MAQVIDTIRYPSTFSELSKDAKFLQFYLKVAPDQFTNIVQFLRAPARGVRVYTEHLSPNAPTPLPASNLIKQNVRSLLAESGIDDNRNWNVIVRGLIDYLTDLFDKKLFPVFFETEHFEEYHASEKLGLAEKQFGKHDSIRKRLGFASTSGMMLQWLTMAMAVKDSADTAKYAKAVLTNEGAPKDAAAIKELVAAIKGQKALSGILSAQVDASVKKLTACGFDVKNKKICGHLKDMAEALAMGKDAEASKALKAAQKLEPAGSAMKTASAKGVAKLFYKHKVL